MADYTRPNYTDGYEIRYNRTTDMFECCQHQALLSKKDGKPAAYKTTALAKKFMQAAGAKEATPEPKSTGWVRPISAVIAPLAEQLASLPIDAPRFVVIEKGYGYYNEQGYAVYDRQEEEIVSSTTYNGWNSVTQKREEAEKEAAYRQENPPVKIAFDNGIVDILAAVERTWERRFEQPLPEPTPPPAEKEVEFLSGPHQIGEVIIDRYGRKYRVSQKSYWISEKEALNLEDGWDASVETGWHTPATLIEEEEVK